MTAPFSTGTSAIRNITHRQLFSSVCRTEKCFGSLCNRSMGCPRFLKGAIWKYWFGISLTTRWQWLPRYLGVFIQTMRSMSTPCIIWSFSRCSPCSDRITAMKTKRAANNRRPLLTAEHSASWSRRNKEITKGVSRSGTEKENQNNHHRSCLPART